MTTVDQPSATNMVLSINNIEVVYDHVILVLKGVSLELPEGGIVTLLGGERRREDDHPQGRVQYSESRARRCDQGLDLVSRRAHRHAVAK